MIDIHITVELQPSPQLVQLLQELRPVQTPAKKPEQPQTELEKFMKERKERKEPKQPDPDLYLLEEIPPFAFYKHEFVDLEINSAMQYYERGDSLCIRYYSARIYTTWTNVKKLYSRFGDVTRYKFMGPLLKEKDTGNRRQGVSYFIRAIGAGLKPGQAAGSQEDPDDDFRSFTKSVIDTSTRVDGGKLEGMLEG